MKPVCQIAFGGFVEKKRIKVSEMPKFSFTLRRKKQQSYLSTIARLNPSITSSVPNLTACDSYISLTSNGLSKGVVLRVYLNDGSHRSVFADNKITAGEVVSRVLKKIHDDDLNEDDYQLFVQFSLGYGRLVNNDSLLSDLGDDWGPLLKVSLWKKERTLIQRSYSSDDILRDSKSCDSTESSWSLDDFSTSYGEIDTSRIRKRSTTLEEKTLQNHSLEEIRDHKEIGRSHTVPSNTLRRQSAIRRKEGSPLRDRLNSSSSSLSSLDSFTSKRKPSLRKKALLRITSVPGQMNHATLQKAHQTEEEEEWCMIQSMPVSPTLTPFKISPSHITSDSVSNGVTAVSSAVSIDDPSEDLTSSSPSDLNMHTESPQMPGTPPLDRPTLDTSASPKRQLVRGERREDYFDHLRILKENIGKESQPIGPRKNGKIDYFDHLDDPPYDHLDDAPYANVTPTSRYNGEYTKAHTLGRSKITTPRRNGNVGKDYFDHLKESSNQSVKEQTRKRHKSTEQLYTRKVAPNRPLPPIPITSRIRKSSSSDDIMTTGTYSPRPVTSVTTSLTTSVTLTYTKKDGSPRHLSANSDYAELVPPPKPPRIQSYCLEDIDISKETPPPPKPSRGPIPKHIQATIDKFNTEIITKRESQKYRSKSVKSRPHIRNVNFNNNNTSNVLPGTHSSTDISCPEKDSRSTPNSSTETGRLNLRRMLDGDKNVAEATIHSKMHRSTTTLPHLASSAGLYVIKERRMSSSLSDLSSLQLSAKVEDKPVLYKRIQHTTLDDDLFKQRLKFSKKLKKRNSKTTSNINEDHLKLSSNEIQSLFIATFGSIIVDRKSSSGTLQRRKATTFQIPIPDRVDSLQAERTNDEIKKDYLHLFEELEALEELDDCEVFESPDEAKKQIPLRPSAYPSLAVPRINIVCSEKDDDDESSLDYFSVRRRTPQSVTSPRSALSFYLDMLASRRWKNNSRLSSVKEFVAIASKCKSFSCPSPEHASKTINRHSLGLPRPSLASEVPLSSVRSAPCILATAALQHTNDTLTSCETEGSVDDYRGILCQCTSQAGELGHYRDTVLPLQD